MKLSKISAKQLKIAIGILVKPSLFVAAVIASIGIPIAIMDRAALKEVPEKLPKAYLYEAEKLVESIDNVAKCKAEYANVMTDSRYMEDGSPNKVVVESILICNNLEAAINKQKTEIDHFFNGKFFKDSQDGVALDSDQIKAERKAFRLSSSEMYSANEEYRTATHKYYVEKAKILYYELKNQLGDTDPQLKARYEAIDRAIALGEDQKFLHGYDEVLAFSTRHALDEISELIKQRNEEKYQSSVKKTVKNSVEVSPKTPQHPD